MKGHKSIRRSMRQNEVEILRYIRKRRLDYFGLSLSWHHAIDRLEAGGMVKYDRKRSSYVARKGARPVTGSVR